MDICRQACGGAGFSNHSLLPVHFLEYSPVVTYEGDTIVMAKQNLSYIQKLQKSIKKGQMATGTLAYINDLQKLCGLKSNATNAAEVSELKHLETALAVRAAYSIFTTTRKIAESNESKKVIYNDLFA